jgi:hypothetical protein
MRIRSLAVRPSASGGVCAEDVEPIASEPVVARILLDAGKLRVNRDHVEPVLDALLFRRGRWQSDAHERWLDTTSGIVVEFALASDAQRTHVRQVQHARQAHLPLARFHQAEQRGMVGLLVERKRKRRRLDARDIVRAQRQCPFAPRDAPDRFAIEFVRLPIEFQTGHRVGLHEHRILVELPVSQRVHRKHAERRRTARQTDGEMLGLKVWFGSMQGD